MFDRSVQAVAFCAMLLTSSVVGAADRRLEGAKIYRQLCSKCHGRNGDGVKGKYDDALHGDWSLEKLTRYIDKNMPEDGPEKCVGPDAEAVARYIYDAFYSREARARNHPARIELLRLTNRQYVNTVADLLRHFAGDEPGLPKEHGLNGTYYHSRDFRGDMRVETRVDRQINFDFGNYRRPEPIAKSIPERTGTNAYSMQWRGSLLAEETGDYEFIVRTPNGARLWVNDQDDPLIDAWVASGKLDEHRASIRLIGGRVYPLRLDYFKFKEKIGAISLLWHPPRGALEPIPARNLSPARSTPTFVLTTRFPPDDSSVGYERGVAISKAWDEAATQAAIEVANYLVKHIDRFSRSRLSDTNRAAKVEKFCTEFVETAFRRPLTEDQKRVYVFSHLKRAASLEDGIKRVVLLTLKSPRFLFLGLQEIKPDDFEVAERLSFDFWDSLPDEALWKAAAKGQLHTREQVSVQARRMLRDRRTHAKVEYFLHHWLQMDHVDDLSKDAKLYPDFTPEIISDLRTSLDLFLEDVVWGGSSDYRKLLLADTAFVNDRLARFYGINTNLTDDFVKVPVDPKERSGVLTHPYLLSAFSYQKSTSPIHRGVFLTRNIVGRTLKPPPMAQTFKDADFAPNLTMREKVAELTRPQACQSCHSVINPLGFSLENYDAVGRFRTHEKGKPINPVSDYTTDDGSTVRLTGPRDLAKFAVGSEHAQKAFIEQLFHQMVKQPIRAYGPDVMDRLRQSFITSDFNVQKLMVEIALTSALHGVSEVPSPKSKG
jgi:hypothetical protein